MMSDVELARQAHHRQEVDRLDYLRAVNRLAQVLTHREIARELKVGEPSIAATLERADDVRPVPDGFSGGGPYEIAQRYAVGQIDREQLIDELTRWEYTPMPASWSKMWETQEVMPDGTVHELGRAFDHRLVDGPTHDEILERLDAQQAGP